MSIRNQLSQLVYTTDQGRIAEPDDKPEPPKGDGIVRIQRETKGRKGKGVTVIHGLELNENELKRIAKELKTRCGVGGSVKNFTIEIQGDQRDNCKSHLESKGFTVKLSGG